jgi:hypothetical protein
LRVECGGRANEKPNAHREPPVARKTWSIMQASASVRR